MIKFSLLLLTAYVLYYAGNIIYDLFLKKEVTTHHEESEVFSLSDFTNEKENPKQSIQPTVTINNFAKEKDEILTVLESLPDKKTEDDNNDVVDVEVTKS